MISRAVIFILTLSCVCMCENITARLESNGLLLVRKNGDYGTVCDDEFDVNDAKVVCRMLGLSTGNIHVLNRVSGGEGRRIFMDGLQCRGNENSLNECKFRGWGRHNCEHYEDVGIKCEGGNMTVSARLESNGLLLVRKNGDYGTVCDDHFDVNDAKVVCRMLGLSTDNVHVLTDVWGGRGRRIFMDDLQCSGNENSLNECNFRGWGRHDCRHYKDVGIKCEGNITARLESNGLLLVRKNGDYGTVCDKNFDVNDAKVVCRMLGRSTDNVLMLNRVSGGNGRSIFVNHFQCRGDENSLNECNYGVQSSDYCGHLDDVGIMCEGKITARLESNGLLLVRTNGDYGTVCGHSFDVNDAKVVCRMLGLSTDNVLVLTGVSGGRGRSIFMDDFRCKGNETSLNECKFRGWGRHYCHHSENVGINCAENITARLESNGLLLVRKNGDYGTVCDDHFDVNDAKVVCRMLGLSTDNVHVLTGVWGGEGRRIFMDDLQCRGNETSLNECKFRGWGRHDCDHSEDVGIKCED